MKNMIKEKKKRKETIFRVKTTVLGSIKIDHLSTPLCK